MCTAITYKTKDLYFGRTLDHDLTYGEEVVITPRRFSLVFRNGERLNSHYSVIGMACVKDGFPLYYDAANEKGLCMAGLNFVGNAVYHEKIKGRTNLAQFEFIPYILGKCSTLEEAENELNKINITEEPFDKSLAAARLHWLIADKSGSVTVEFVEEGMKVYDNPVGVLTNNPPFRMQMFNLNNYMGLTAGQPVNTFSENIGLSAYSLGMGALGLPGDMSSQSRFVRTAFTKHNCVSGESEEESVNSFFHILGSVNQTRGCSRLNNGKYETTIYTSCCNADKGIYYYTTYKNHCICAVNLFKEWLDGYDIIQYPLKNAESIIYHN